uniref:Uncharacterized protein n=1 Tax=Meloidogyne incognita TaxID=6306 RepID=A0A914LDV8_MELIC
MKELIWGKIVMEKSGLELQQLQNLNIQLMKFCQKKMKRKSRVLKRGKGWKNKRVLNKIWKKITTI